MEEDELGKIIVRRQDNVVRAISKAIKEYETLETFQEKVLSDILSKIIWIISQSDKMEKLDLTSISKIE